MGVVDTSGLRNLGNFRRGALEHIFEGEINRIGQAVGYHYEGYPTARGEIISGTKSSPNNMDIYRGDVKVDNIIKRGNSTFFPENFTPQQVIDNINEAYVNRVHIGGNKYYGNTNSGIEVRMFLDRFNKIISAFPKY